MTVPSDTSRSRSPRRTTNVAKIKEITQLCAPLEACLHAYLDLAGGDASRVVLVLDLDETSFTPLTVDGLATSAWFEDIMQRWAPRLKETDGMTHTDILQSILTVVDAFYPLVPVGLTDTQLPALLRKCKELGIASVGLTARRPELAPATWLQMGNRCDLTFDSLAPPATSAGIKSLEQSLRAAEHVSNPDCWEGVSCERGIWFTANVNKGSILLRLLDAGKYVVFADDSIRHLQSVNKALDGHAAAVTSFHFTAATTSAKQKLDAIACDSALAAHLAALFVAKEASIMELVLKRQTFLSRFVASQVDAKKKADEEVDSSLQALADALSSEASNAA